jgi:hypothetical protein
LRELPLQARHPLQALPAVRRASIPAVENQRRGNTYEATTIGWPAVEALDWCGEWKAKP